MSERVLYSTRLKSIRTAPPGYDIPTCQGALCQVTTERLILPGAAYGSEIPLKEIGQADPILQEGNLRFFVEIDTPHDHLLLCCESQDECEDLAAAIQASPGISLP